MKKHHSTIGSTIEQCRVDDNFLKKSLSFDTPFDLIVMRLHSSMVKQVHGKD